MFTIFHTNWKKNEKYESKYFIDRNVYNCKVEGSDIAMI